ncbi:MAG TPA: phosphatase PAP2 family protein [Candidatus Competibacter sp.]|nr:phosphatase PAP2 family protein [Candidatus Competibacter sp.]MCC9003565.1 phosphatase PAP2 family protein [Candidatus Competibacter sp.]HRF61901.1 phosphatase PAP2 family protein [Candidatus Competibacter sp.]HRX63208.1 phosphatase PAP2 family protein [Candidatus Competibacter sp.]HUM91135.1 phosphatase PAP2 family protein [Candidatus Competibacter sp.]
MSDTLLNETGRTSPSTSPCWVRLTEWELVCCLRFQQFVRHRSIIRLFALVSRLGDGVFWYSLMATLLLVRGAEAAPVVGRMLLAGAICLILYKWLKARTTRSRPCARDRQIQPRVAPLDEYSFPSGHTLHAVSFTLIAVYHYPALGWLLLPFAVLVALSRIVLGLHYPSDVLAGAVLGGGLALLAL